MLRQWEYLHVPITPMPRLRAEDPFEDTQALLSRLGLERWELLSVYERNPGSTSGPDLWGIFKREKVEEPGPCNECGEKPHLLNGTLQCKCGRTAVYGYKGESRESLVASWNKLIGGES